VEQVAGRILAFLQCRTDEKKAKGGQAFFKEAVHLYGVGGADIRAFSRELFQELRAEWRIKDAIRLCDRLLPNPFLEVKGVAILLLGKFMPQARPGLFPKAKSWLQRGFCANWATVDTLCPEVVSPLLDQFPELRQKMRAWPMSSNRWVKRASVVSFIPLARRGKALDGAYANARALLGSPDDLVQKANGWLLREAGKADGRRLERFLLAHGPSIPRTTLRYAVERFPLERRKRIMQKTRSRKDHG
jgi:3-methyladenine DNA glycosylase AlkD